MQVSRVRVFLLLAVSSALCIILSCGPPPKPVMATLQVPTLNVHGEAEQTKDGMTVSVLPIGPENAKRFPQIHKIVTFTAMQRNVLSGKEEPVKREGSSVIIPTPAFQVRIINKTGHVVRFSTVVFRLQDNTGKTYPLYASTNELIAWLENAWSTAVGPEAAKEVMKQLSVAIGSLQFLTRSVELLNGDEWSGYLAFNMGVNGEEDYYNFMNGIQRLKLRLAEVPTGTSAAGQVSKTAEFAFMLDKINSPVRVTCPAGTAKPSLQRCNAE